MRVPTQTTTTHPTHASGPSAFGAGNHTLNGRVRGGHRTHRPPLCPLVSLAHSIHYNPPHTHTHTHTPTHPLTHRPTDPHSHPTPQLPTPPIINRSQLRVKRRKKRRNRLQRHSAASDGVDDNDNEATASGSMPTDGTVFKSVRALLGLEGVAGCFSGGLWDVAHEAKLVLPVLDLC